jgi:hypothetical protein
VDVVDARPTDRLAASGAYAGERAKRTGGLPYPSARCPGDMTNQAMPWARRFQVEESQPMAEPEVEAAWRAEFKRIGETQPRNTLDSGGGLTDELQRQAAFRWPGDEAEARRLQEGQTYHYVRWTVLVAVAAVIAGLIAVGLALLR